MIVMVSNLKSQHMLETVWYRQTGPICSSTICSSRAARGEVAASVGVEDIVKG